MTAGSEASEEQSGSEHSQDMDENVWSEEQPYSEKKRFSRPLPTKDLMRRANEVRYLHIALGHPSDKSLESALNNGNIINTYLTGRDVSNAAAWLGPCTGCQLGKMTRRSLSESNMSDPPTQIGDSVYVDIQVLSEDLKKKSIGGYNHVLLTLDRYSGMMHTIRMDSRHAKSCKKAFH